MKKLIATASGFIGTLALAAPVFAENVDPCPDDLGNRCELDSSQFGEIISTALNVIIVIAVIIAVFFLVWGGIKWITSGGDKAKVESARNTIIAGIIGLVFVFLAYFLISLIANIFGIDISDDLELPELGT